MEQNRKNFLNTNKYQKPIIIIPFIGTFVLAILLTIVVGYLNKDLTKYIAHGGLLPNIRLINKWAIFIIFNIWLFVTIIILWSLIVSGNLVGAFERLFREMDEYIAGSKKMPFKVRKSDDLGEELVKRLNRITGLADKFD